MALYAFDRTRNEDEEGNAVTDKYGEAIAGIRGLVSWWRFGEAAGATTAIDEQGTQDGAYQGGVALGQAPLPGNTDNTEVALNGTDAFIEVTHHADYNLTAGTALVWFRPTALGANRQLLSKDTSAITAGDLFLGYLFTNNELRFQIKSASTSNQASATAVLSPDVTYCAAIQWGSGGMKLWLASGGSLKQVASNAYTGGINANTQNWRIGATQWRGSAGDFFAGTLGDVIIWNRQLNAAELQTATQASLDAAAGYEAAVAGLKPAIYLKLNDASDATVVDASGNGRNGTITGTPVGYNVASLASSTGAGNGGLNLGKAASISIPQTSADTSLTMPSDWAVEQSTDEFRFIADTTISIWFKINAMPTGSNKAVVFAKSHSDAPGTANSYAESTPILASRGATVNGGSFAAYFDANGAVHVDMRSFRGRPCIVRTPDGAVTTNTAYHLVVQLSYDGVTAWLNGAKFEDGHANLLHVYGLCANIRGVVFRNNYAWTIGKAAWGGQANIIVDEFAVFHRAPSATISQSNVNALAQQGSTPAALAHYIWGARNVNENAYAGTAGTTQRIQNAIADVNASGGGTVLINPGTYTGNITLASNVRLKANGGTVNITGRCVTPTLSPSTLTDNAGDFLTGDRTLDITNSRAAGDIIKVMATQGNPVNTGTAAMRLDRRWNSTGESNDPSVPDCETFEIESRTGSEITFVGAGSTYDFASANRQFIQAFTPTKWIALEGDLRFTGTNTVEFGWCNYARVVGIRATNTSTSADQALWGNQHARNVQIRSCTSVQGTLVAPAAENDGIAFWNGCIDCVVKDCSVFAGRHGADVAGNANFGPGTRCEFHNVTWAVGASVAGGQLSAFGVHGTSTDCIYWNCNSDKGGPAATGWKHCSRWMVCGDPNAAGSGAIHIEDGGLECVFRDLHVIRPNVWFGVFGGATSVDKCHFENITRTSNPTDPAIHANNYGTGALVNTYSGTVDGLPSLNVWQQV